MVSTVVLILSFLPVLKWSDSLRTFEVTGTVAE